MTTQKTELSQFNRDEGIGMFGIYPDYEETNIEHVGAIPSNWDVVKLKSVARSIRTGSTPSTSNDDYYDQEDVPWYGPESISNNLVVDEPSKWISEMAINEGAAPKFESDSVLITIIGNVGEVAYLDKSGSSNQQIKQIKFDPEKLDNRYAAYQLKSFESVFDSLAPITTLPILGKKELEYFRMAVPPKNQQKDIVKFLDRETQKIDELVKKKEELIDFLEEKRTAVIKNAVRKGLDLEVDMNDSGVEWLGEIPEHWNVPRIRFVARMESGHTPSKSEEEYWDGDIPWVSLADSGHLRENDYISETDKTISEAGLANSSARILPSETMVFTRDATVGLCAITTREMAVSQHIIGWICEDNLLPEYLLNVTKSMDQELDRLTMGATISTVGMEDIKKLKMPLPPIEEQEEIVEYLNEELEKFDNSVEKIQEGIDRLKEYRTALITEAVTGKIDVRGEV